MKKIFILILLFGFIICSVAFANQVENTKVAGNSIGTEGTGSAVDSQNHRAHCYRDPATNSLMFAFFDGNDWQTEVVENDQASGKPVGLYCALVFDAQDRPHIVYYQKTDKEIRHARKINDNWEILLVDDEAPVDLFIGLYVEDYHRLSLAMDSHGILATAYYDALDNDLVYAEWDGQDWNLITVESDGDVGKYASVVFDGNDNPGIVYVKESVGQNAALMFVFHDGQDWLASEVIDDANKKIRYASFNFDENSVPHVAYQALDQNNYTFLKYTNKVAGNWNAPATLEHGAMLGHYCQLTATPEGNMHVIYRNYFLSALFPNVNAIKMYHVYFADKLKPGEARYSVDQIIFSSAPVRDYVSFSINSNDQGQVVYSYLAQNQQDNNYSLYSGVIAGWTPQIALITPNTILHRADNDQFEFRWVTFAAEPDSEIRFVYWDANFNEVVFGDTLDLADGLSAVIDTALVPAGERTVFIKMSSDNFQHSVMARGRADLVIPVRDNAPAENPDREPMAGNKNHNDAAGNNGDVVPANRPPSRPSPVVENAADSEEMLAAREEGKIRLRIENAEDEDGDVITYVIQICADADCQNPIYERANLDADGGDVTDIELSAEDIGVGDFYWRVKAVDENDESSDWSTPVKFSLDSFGEDNFEDGDADGAGDEKNGFDNAAAASGCSLVTLARQPGDTPVILLLAICFIPLLLTRIIYKLK